MKKTRLTNTTDTYFQEAWNLYGDAFPLEERRGLASQTKVIQKPKYHFDVMTAEKQLIGFLLWWDFKEFRYIDHFATANAVRNKGFGTLILEEFMENNEKPILLEVELPETSMDQRRIKFYERIGFKSNPHYYEIPPVKEGASPLQLLVMSYPNEVSAQAVEAFVKTCHPIIFEG